MAEEEILDVITSAGGQFLETVHDGATLLVRDRAHDSVPTMSACIKSNGYIQGATETPKPSFDVPPLTVVDIVIPPAPDGEPRSRAMIIRHALKMPIFSGKLDQTLLNGAVDFNAFMDVLGSLENRAPNTWRDFEVATNDPFLKVDFIGNTCWLSDSAQSQIPLVSDEWFSPDIPIVVDVVHALADSCPGNQCITTPQASSSPTKDSIPPQVESPRSNPSSIRSQASSAPRSPFTLAAARLEQAHTEDAVSPRKPPASLGDPPSASVENGAMDNSLKYPRLVVDPVLDSGAASDPVFPLLPPGDHEQTLSVPAEEPTTMSSPSLQSLKVVDEVPLGLQASVPPQVVFAPPKLRPRTKKS